MVWGYVIAAVAAAVFSYVLAPKPSTANPATKENFKFSTVQPGESFLVMRGTRDISPAIVAWGLVRIKKKKIGGGKK